jgi:capsular exopolysaccharide synthesis family protein
MSLLQLFVREQLEGVEWFLNPTLAMLRRRAALIFAVAGLCLAATAGLLLLTPSKYTAQAMLQINTRHEQVTNVSEVLSGLSSSDPAVRTEMDVLRSRRLAAAVIRKLNLMQLDPSLNRDSFGVMLRHGMTYFLFPASNTAAGGMQARLTRATDNFVDNLEVRMLPHSFSIVLDYTARDPQLAAQVANAVALEYLNSQLEDRFEATRRASDWIAGRLKQLRSEVYDAELATQKFRESHNLTQAKGVTLTEQQLSELNSQLILARTQLAEAEAKLTQAQSGGGIETNSEVLNSPLIQNLREQETEVRRKMSDLASRYGARHPRMQTVKNELADVQRKIREETVKIQGSLGNDVAVAKARVATLQDQLEALQQQTSLSTTAEVQLAELERQAQAARNLYENFLSRSKELAQMDLSQADARVIYPAEAPLYPSQPQPWLWLPLAALLGLTLGIALALLLDALDSGFRTLEQLEGVTGAPALGLLAELLPAEGSLFNYAQRKPNSAFAESIRAARAALRFANPDQMPQVILVTSSVPGEGKSLFSASLAHLAALGGQKVLLLEADLRRPTLAQQFALKPRQGLAEVLGGETPLSDALYQPQGTRLTVLPAVDSNPFAPELLASGKMKKLLGDLRKKFDLIILDSPPVTAVADATLLAGLADSVLFVVRWGITPRTVVVKALAALKAAHAPLAGCLLSRVDFSKQKTYGYGSDAYTYNQAQAYYSD